MKYFGVEYIETKKSGIENFKYKQKLFDKPYLDERFPFGSIRRPYVLKNLKVRYSLIDKEIKLMGIYYELAKEKLSEYRDYA